MDEADIDVDNQIEDWLSERDQENYEELGVY